jgi:hypothetical protein
MATRPETITIATPTPVNMGAKLQQVKGPLLVNWPRDNSRKKMGTPTNANMMQYGMKKAPEICRRYIG